MNVDVYKIPMHIIITILFYADDPQLIYLNLWNKTFYAIFWFLKGLIDISPIELLLIVLFKLSNLSNRQRV